MTDIDLSKLPPSLEALSALALNLRWSWHAPTRELFERLDPALWRSTGQNPVRLLAEVDAGAIERAAADSTYRTAVRAAVADLDAYMAARSVKRAEMPRVAYLCAEFGIAECLPILSGGLGILAGDHLKSASDLGLPLVGIGLFYHEGYFTQQMDREGRQEATYRTSLPGHLPLRPELDRDGRPVLIRFPFADRHLHARIWRADVGRVPLYLLDADVPENQPEDRTITDQLYGGDVEHRLKQEMLLGIGGMRALEALRVATDVIHLNEGHAAFAALERAAQRVRSKHGAVPDRAAFREVLQRASQGVIYTTHTPVPAGHDYFPAELLKRYMGGYIWELRESWGHFVSLGRLDAADEAEPFCMTLLALRASARRNGVSRLHGKVSREMWRAAWPGTPEAEVPIGHVTNGVHLPTWVAPAMADVYARHLGAGWQREIDPFHWRRADQIPAGELWSTRCALRGRLVDEVRRALRNQLERRGEVATWTADALDPDALTIVFARRFATYKRATLLLSQPERMVRLLNDPTRPVQFVFAGKAHPKDVPGQELLRQVFQFAADPAHRRRFVFLEGYDPALARTLVQGADVWLNLPLRPYEASGTSGMKAAANGGLNLSIPDGWWAEAWTDHNRLPDPIGWSIDAGEEAPSRDAQDRADADALFDILEADVLPVFYDRIDALPVRWIERVRASIRQVPAFFSTHRMVGEYLDRYYQPAALADARAQRLIPERTG